ncbi:hypothetical protein EBU99_08960 [bacterium]|nr:hypothetical protein [bacterium]
MNLEHAQEFQTLIIPTVMIPLTALTVALTMVASFIAGLFGIRLKTEGPRRLLEVLLKPRVYARTFSLFGARKLKKVHSVRHSLRVEACL